LLGVISLESEEPDLFEDEDRLFLEQIARAAATVLAAAGRKDNAQKIITAARKAATDPEHGLDIIAESAHHIASQAGVGPTSTTVFLLTGKILELASAWPPEQFGRLKKKVGVLTLEVPAGQPRGIVATAAVDRRSQMVKDVIHSDSYIPFDDRTRAELAVPIFSADQRVIGVLNLEYENPQALNIEDQTALEALANQMVIVAALQSKAQAIFNQQDFKAETEDYKRHLEDHAAKTKLATISKSAHLGLGFLSDLRMDKWKVLNRVLHRLLFRRSIVSVLAKLNSCFERIISATSKLNSNGTSEELIEPLVVVTWIDDFTAGWMENEPGIDFTVITELGKDDRIEVDKYQFTMAMDNIINNALSAAQSNSRQQPPRITLTAKRVATSITIEIADNGDGVYADVRRFLYLHKIPDTLVNRNGHGVGCFYTGKTIRKFKGDVEVLTERPEPARILVSMPAFGN
jgi:putative methionine-R-sulfoxide reductase with GAF domain